MPTLKTSFHRPARNHHMYRVATEFAGGSLGEAFID
jgi:hypothetical protein